MLNLPVLLEYRAKIWLSFLDAACLDSEKAWQFTVLMVITCFCFFSLLFFQAMHFLFVSEFLFKVRMIEIVYQVKYKIDLHEVGS